MNHPLTDAQVAYTHSDGTVHVLREWAYELEERLDRAERSWLACPRCGARYDANRVGCGYCEAEAVQGGNLALRARYENLQDAHTKISRTLHAANAMLKNRVDSLILELTATEQARLHDNEYLIAERDKLKAELIMLRIEREALLNRVEP